MANDVDELDAFTDEELTELALAADPDAPLDDDAVAISTFRGELPALLPQWYMPTPMAHSQSRWRRLAVVAIIVAFLGINGLGFCITYGQLVVA